MGALEFQPSLGPKYIMSEKLNVDWVAQLASDILTRCESIRWTQTRTQCGRPCRAEPLPAAPEQKPSLRGTSKQTRPALVKLPWEADLTIDPFNSMGSAETETAT